MIVVPLQKRKLILQMCHNAKFAGHFGVAKTQEKVKKHFFWKVGKKMLQCIVTVVNLARKKEFPELKQI